MNILSRIILSIYMLLMVFVSICIIVMPFGLIPKSAVSAIIAGIYSSWYYSLAGAMLFIVSLSLLFSGMATDNKSRRGIIKPAEFGDIKISVDAFESMALRVVRQLSGIKDVKVRVDPGNGDITVFTKLLVMPDINIPKVTGEVQKKIKEYIEASTDINVREVKVSVDNIAGVSAARVE